MGLFTNGLAQQRPQTMLPGFGSRQPWQPQFQQPMPMQRPMQPQPQPQPMTNMGQLGGNQGVALPPNGYGAQQGGGLQGGPQPMPMPMQHQMPQQPMTNMGMVGGSQGVPVPPSNFGPPPGAAVTNGMTPPMTPQPQQVMSQGVSVSSGGMPGSASMDMDPRLLQRGIGIGF
jgi:hypothetical protein